MSECNESLEILTYIQEHGPVTAEDVTEKTGYIRHLVDTAIRLLVQYGHIYQSGTTSKWGDPVYKSVSK